MEGFYNVTSGSDSWVGVLVFLRALKEAASRRTTSNYSDTINMTFVLATSSFFVGLKKHTRTSCSRCIAIVAV